MDVILLRTLTRKSFLKFGKYYDLRVQEVLNLYHFRILRWYYFNMSMISYNDDLKKELGITKEFEIKKPGINSELGIKLQDIKDANQYGLDRYTDKKKQSRINKAKYVQFKKGDRKRYSKGAMQRSNHNKK